MHDDPIRVLVVDDSAVYRKIISEILREIAGVEVVGTAANGRIALQRIAQSSPDLITLDCEMPVMDGLDLLKELQAQGSPVAAIMLSSLTEADAKATVAAVELGAFDFIPKPAGKSPAASEAELRQALTSKLEAFTRSRKMHCLRKKGSHRPQPAQPAATPAKPPVHRTCGVPLHRPKVIAIGISTGGPQALNRMMPQLPADLGAPVLIVQHMPAFFTRSLAESLNAKCALQVCEAREGQEVQPGMALIAPGGKQMKVERLGEKIVIRLTDDPPEQSCKPAADYLFRSVGQVYGAEAMGVVMTGMGHDGSLGCKLLKSRGATVLAQDESSCVVYGMPKGPTEQGLADIVAPLDKIAGEIVRVVGKAVPAWR